MSEEVCNGYTCLRRPNKKGFCEKHYKRHKTDKELLDLATLHQDFWEGTVWAKVIRNAIDELDYELLEELLIKSARAMGQDYEVEV